MEGFLNLRIAAWLRRLLTRLIAIVPALITVIFLVNRAQAAYLFSVKLF